MFIVGLAPIPVWNQNRFKGLFCFGCIVGEDLLPSETQHLESMQNFAGALEYLSTWHWAERGIITAGTGIAFTTGALPQARCQQARFRTL